MRRYLIASAATVAACLTVIGTATFASASTVDVLTTGSAGGPNVAVGNVLTGTLSSGTSATFYEATTGTTGGVCTAGALSQTVTSNPAAGGNAASTVTSQTFSSCTDNISTTINSIVINSGYTSEIGSEGTFIPSASATLKGVFDGLFVETCHYSGTSLSGNSVFTNQEFTKASGSTSTCPSVFYFSATYSALSDVSVSGSPEVFENS